MLVTLSNYVRNTYTFLLFINRVCSMANVLCTLPMMTTVCFDTAFSKKLRQTQLYLWPYYTLCLFTSFGKKILIISEYSRGMDKVDKDAAKVYVFNAVKLSEHMLHIVLKQPWR